jgi:hypothetical protein
MMQGRPTTNDVLGIAAVADSKRGKSGSFGGPFSDIIETVKAYVMQETVDPLRGVGRFIGFGLAGAVFITLGMGFLLLSLLRLLQTRDVGAFHGNWSFVPYLITLVPCVLAIVLAISRIGKTGLDRPKERS